jgi:hypothetical protein
MIPVAPDVQEDETVSRAEPFSDIAASQAATDEIRSEADPSSETDASQLATDEVVSVADPVSEIVPDPEPANEADSVSVADPDSDMVPEPERIREIVSAAAPDSVIAASNAAIELGESTADPDSDMLTDQDDPPAGTFSQIVLGSNICQGFADIDIRSEFVRVLL